MHVISAEENERFSFPETGQFNFFISRKTLHFNPPKKGHFNLSKTASLFSRKDKFQSPENRSIVISRKLPKMIHLNLPKMIHFNLPKMTHFNLLRTTHFNLPKTEVL